MSVPENSGTRKSAREKLRVLFVCHGNICRSPMAEFVFKDAAKKAGLGAEVYAESAAVSSEELGNPVYPPVRELLAKLGISCAGKVARKVSKADYDNFDLIAVMDRSNLANISRIIADDPQGKIRMLLEFAGRPNVEVADPWYTGDFEATWQDVLDGCQGLLKELLQERGKQNGTE